MINIFFLYQSKRDISEITPGDIVDVSEPTSIKD